jgi:hypothetical protein
MFFATQTENRFAALSDCQYMTYQHALDNDRDLREALATTSIDGKSMFKIMMRDEHWTFRCYLCCMSVGPATALIRPTLFEEGFLAMPQHCQRIGKVRIAIDKKGT